VGSIGSAGDPVVIDITYPSGTDIPDGENIKIFHNGKSITDGGWIEQGVNYVRDYTVTAESGKQKHYRVEAAEGTEPPVPAEEACEILLYYFTKPNGELLGIGNLILDDSSGELDNPVKITITYPEEIPVDERIVVLTSPGAGIAPDPSWTAQEGSFVRNYTVTAESGATKHYRVTATKDAPAVTPVTGVSLTSANLALAPGQSKTLTATVSPGNASNKAVTWTSSNPGVADVTNVTVDPQTGAVTLTVSGSAVGSAVIVVTTKDGGYTVTCTVSVVNPGEDGVDSYGIDSRAKWLAALKAVTDAADGASVDNPHVFVFNIMGDFSVEGISAASFGGNHKEVLLIGSKTISLDPVGSNGHLIRTAANQSFVIDGITLQGKEDNSASLVYIDGNSTVELRSGYIKENIRTGGDGVTVGAGGVIISNNGTFTMTGGTISGNTATNSLPVGGGVYVHGGTFNMKSGTISGNTAGNKGSGGVYVASGTFTMTGGTINENTATDSGGGVYVYSSGTFTMTGGTINENTATDSGGGVHVEGTFTMNGGTVSGNSANSGGGVHVQGTFTMSGGTVSGNTAANTGGGVYVVGSSTAFTKTGGTIYGDSPADTNTPQNSGLNANTATSTSNKGKNGHAVLLYKSPNYYYRNEDLTGADNISTTAALPVSSGETANKWTKR
jgi:parallel beta-helix repeat protein